LKRPNPHWGRGRINKIHNFIHSFTAHCHHPLSAIHSPSTVTIHCHRCHHCQPKCPRIVVVRGGSGDAWWDFEKRNPPTPR
jgi:flavoprotein